MTSLGERGDNTVFFYVFLNNWVVFKLVDGFLVDVRAFPSKKKKLREKPWGRGCQVYKWIPATYCWGGGGV